MTTFDDCKDIYNFIGQLLSLWNLQLQFPKLIYLEKNNKIGVLQWIYFNFCAGPLGVSWIIKNPLGFQWLYVYSQDGTPESRQFLVSFYSIGNYKSV